MFILLFILFTVLLFKKLFFSYKSDRSYGKLPGPINLPIIGSTYLLDKDRTCESFDKLFKKYGNLFYMKFGSHDCVIISCPKLIKHVLLTNGDITSERYPFEFTKHFNGSKSLLASTGEYWKKSRQIIISSFSKHKMGGSFDQLYQTQYNKLENSIKQSISTFGNIISIRDDLMKYTFNVVYTSLFGEELEFNNSPIFNQVLYHSNKIFSSFPKAGDIIDILKPFTSYKEIYEMRDYFLNDLIESKLQGILSRFDHDNPTCAIDNMIIGINEYNNTHNDKLITIESLKYFIFDLIIGGLETTARSLEWFIILMINNQDCQNLLHNELLENQIKSPLLIDKYKYKYLNSSIKETLRIKPVATCLPHKNSNDLLIDNHVIPKDTLLFINLYSFNFNDQYYKDPYKFNPSRFLSPQSIDDSEFKYSNFTFGYGSRVCPFQNFSLDEQFYAISRLFQNFQFQSPFENNLKIDETPILKLTYQPLNNWNVKIIERN